jgi:tRNA pseudouridine38-40 synthase
MPRYKLTLEYAGTRYSGWQIQNNARTVQGELHRAVTEGLRIPRFESYGSGRTDAGVHALAQVAHLDLPAPLPPDTIVDRLNQALPHDINILEAERMPPRFHARRTAFAKPFVWWVREPLHLARMTEAASALVGFSDFQSFTDDDPQEKSTTVLLERVAVAQVGHLVLIRVVGSHFLWKMVRRITGVLVEVGRGGLAPADMRRLLTSQSDLPPRLTAPGSGLFLERVFYEPPPANWPLEPPVFKI